MIPSYHRQLLRQNNYQSAVVLTTTARWLGDKLLAHFSFLSRNPQLCAGLVAGPRNDYDCHNHNHIS